MNKKILAFLTLIMMVLVFVSCTAGKMGADNSTFIGEERAKEIALEKAGISKEEVVFEKVKLDMDDGIWKYEVEFKKDYTEYDADIKAIDGTVLKWEVEKDKRGK